MVSAGKKVVTVWVKRVVAIMTGFGGKLGGKDRQAKAAKKAKLVISIGKAIMRVLAGEVMLVFQFRMSCESRNDILLYLLCIEFATKKGDRDRRKPG